MTADQQDLQRLLDEQRIRDVVGRFALALDERRWGDYAALYAEDGVLDLPHGRAVGREEIARWVAGDLGRYVATHHAGGHVVIDVDGDRAEVRASLLARHIESEDGRSTWSGGGWYAMRLQRAEDGWLLASVQPRPTWLQLTGDSKGPRPPAER